MENRERVQDETTERGQPRIVPDRAGWWLAQYDGGKPQCMLVEAVYGERIDIADVSIPAFVPGGMLRWLAPIPGPAVLAALAEYTAAIYAIDNAPVDSEERDEAFEDWEASRSKMHAAIRAERDAERDGGA